jgi:oligosaccharyltransferase complex subunit alpha (ribophorin I)
MTYGPFQNIEPLTFSQIQLFFTYPYPLPYFTKATRDIYVSHWGSIAVDEYFYLYNQAAGINGQFSRVDYMPHINPSHGQNAINSLGTTLPVYISGLYYYDYIGNISSSNAERTADNVVFNIEPRFPIFGQWKTDWNQGYQMPTEHHLYQNKDRPEEHTLEIDFMHAYDKSLTEDYQVKLILPEGAQNIRVELPSTLEPDSISEGKFFGTLDYFGRPEVIIRKKNAVHEICEGMVRVTYTFDNHRDLYLEPLCVFALLFALYLIAIIYSRLGLTLESKALKKILDSKKNQ